MQYMLDICDSYAIDYDVKFNCEKSAAPRTGPRHCYSCAEVTLSGKSLVYVTSIKYLGVYVTSAKRFKCSYDHVKLKIYRAFNALYYRSQCSNSELVTVELLMSYCLPLLLYAVESSALSKKIISMMMLDKCVDAAVRKIFRVSSSVIVRLLGLVWVRVILKILSEKELLSLYTIL